MTAPRRHRLAYWTAFVVALAAVVAGAVIAVDGYAQSGPDAAVSGYFAALEHADAPAALSYGAMPPGPHTLLTSAVLRQQQQIAPIAHVQVHTLARHGGIATVAVSYTLGFFGHPRQVTDRLQVHRTGHDWMLARTTVNVGVRLHQAVDRASILGTRVPRGGISIFPGALPVGFDTPNLRLDPAASTVTLSSGGTLAPSVELTGTGRSAVLAAVRSALRSCLARDPDPRCPVPSDRYVPGSIRGKLAGLAHVSLSVEHDPFGVVHVSASGRVGHATYRTLDFDNQPMPHTGTVTLPITARVAVHPPLTVIWTGAT
jgi:hypothetical protein